MGFFKDFIDTVCILFVIFCDPIKRCVRCMFPKPIKSIKGEVVLITGAGHGLGKELSLRLSQFGPVLVLWDINQDNNNAVAAQLREAGHTVYAYRVDVTNQQEVIDAANQVKQDVGDVTILINNAGVFSGHPLVDLPNQVVRLCFDVNVVAHFWILQQFLPRMIELDRGHIVAVASIAGHLGTTNMTDYCASKHAAVGLMESLYMELQAAKKKNIKLTTINPVIITTGLISNVKSRFPSLLPLLNVEETVRVMIRSILKEEDVVFIPKKVTCLVTFLSCFTLRTRYKIYEYVNYGFDLSKPVNNNPKTKIEEV